MKNLTTKTICGLYLLCISNLTQAQLTENFSDGDFTANPSWIGNTGDWNVNANQQLQSNNQVANSSFYLSTANTLATQAQWEFYTQLAFSTSGSNYVDVYLIASQSDLTQSGNTGYFVRIGNTDDEISLYRKDGGSSTKIIDGINSSVGSSNNIIKIKVTRDAGNQWVLYRDIAGSGSNYTAEGMIVDGTYTASAFFGVLVKQSTASFFQKHFFDDITITNYVPDTTPPRMLSAVAATPTTVNVTFSEPVDPTTGQNLANYSVATLGNPSAAGISPADAATVILSFGSNFSNNTTYDLSVNNVKDLAGNAMTTTANTKFTWFVPGRYSIVIDEIMADPTPVVGLPEAEWIELRNTAPVAINIQNYRLGKASGISGPMPSFLLQADSFVIVTTSSQVAALSAFGRTISVTSFPSLSNDADQLYLRSANDEVMHTVSYGSNWYQNTVKANGGWTLEMIDSHNPCAGSSNWKASVDNNGGTPGKKNSVDGTNADTEGPVLSGAFAPDSATVILYFNEPLDSIKASETSSYSTSDGIGVAKAATPLGPFFTSVSIVLNTPLAKGKIYTVSVNNVTDCSGNTITGTTARLGLASHADSLDLIANEILYNPKDFGVDYLELYNRSNKIIDLSTISIANRSSSTNAISTPVQVSADHYLFFPGEFIALTSEPATIQKDYVAKDPKAFIAVELPSFPDTKGSAVVLNERGNIVDELDYDDKWHFALVDNTEGVSLERIDYKRPTNDGSNWTSAAASAGFGTPGYVNSQYHAEQSPQGQITIDPKIFSPDGDGYDDFTYIQFQFPEPGYVVNITIYDAAGRPVRVLQRNTTTAASGVFRWDGLNDKLQKVPIGSYVVYTDIFNLKGQKKHFKNTVVVAKKF